LAARGSATTGRGASSQRQTRISYADPSAALTTLKREPETAWLNEVSSVPPQQARRHLDRACRNVFAGRAKDPTCQKQRGRQAAASTTSALRWDAHKRSLILAKIEETLGVGKVVHHRRLAQAIAQAIAQARGREVIRPLEDKATG
jgi:transposase